jgi:hypothetical protein
MLSIDDIITRPAPDTVKTFTISKIRIANQTLALGSYMKIRGEKNLAQGLYITIDDVEVDAVTQGDGFSIIDIIMNNPDIEGAE